MNLLGLVLLAVGAVVQAQVLPIVLPPLVGADLRPHLLVLLVVAVTLVEGVREGAVWAFMGGLLLDLMSPVTPMGTNALCLLFVALLTSLGLYIPLRVSLIMPLVMTALATLFYYLLLMSIRALFGVSMDWSATLLLLALPTAAINAVLMPFCYSALGWASDRFRPRLPDEWQQTRA